MFLFDKKELKLYLLLQ